MIELNLIQTPNQEFSVMLNDQPCTIQLRQLGDYLYLSLTVEQQIIVQSAICMIGMLILQNRHKGFNGNFVLIDSISPPDHQEQANWQELDSRFKLFYLTDLEVEDVINANIQQLTQQANSTII